MSTDFSIKPVGAPVAAPMQPVAPAAPAFVAPPAPAFIEPPVEAPRAAAFVEAPFETPRAAMPLPPKPELPNPAAAQGLEPKAYQEHFVAAPREFHAAESSAPFTPPVPPRAISEILLPHAAPARAATESELPPDHPLEPGTRPAARSSTRT